MDMQQMGKKIAALRKNNRYTQETLAEKLCISPQAVSKWETGIGLPEASMLITLSKLFHISIDVILQPEKKPDGIIDFMNQNLAAPAAKLLKDIPFISRWNPPPECDMFYSMPAMIAEALCCIEAYEKSESQNVAMELLNDRFRDLMHIMGIGYGFLWLDSRHMIEELWRINDFYDMADRVMRYYGRNYLWLTEKDTTPDEMRRIILWSVDRGHPVVMEWAGGIPEFSIITGYEENGNTLIGWTYCGECAAKTNAWGMFVNPAHWDEDSKFNALVIGDVGSPTYSDKDSLHYALEVLDRKVSGDKSFEEYIAGDAALQKWMNACDTDENTIKLFTVSDIFTYGLQHNSIYAQKCSLPYYKKLGERYSREVHDVVCQITIAIDRIESERNGLDRLKDNPAEHAAACRQFIGNLIKHREYIRGWIKEIIELL
ncbi:MAG: helix-turn-helix domain-containing protein [Oscillospiraceae bacterium]|nr:helix-turn-helix domain-containing protein [Oscillospiraceae bacterium]